MRLGILTGGGDCPGLNAVIRAIVITACREYSSTVIGFADGYRGLMENRAQELYDDGRIDKILTRGGTILGTARVHPEKLRASLPIIDATLRENKIDALIPIGGEGTMKAAAWLAENNYPIVGVPKTIDNDIDKTERTFGFDTAVSIATDAIDRLHSTAESHKRVMLVEVMGRHAGWIALYAGVAAGAHMIVIPEVPFKIDDIRDAVEKRFARGEKHFICVIAEGAKPAPGAMEYNSQGLDEYGHEKLIGISHSIAFELQKRIPNDVRTTVLGHVQRGGTPTAFDRVLATRYGIAATRAAHNNEFGQMVALESNKITLVALSDAVASLKLVKPENYSDLGLLIK